MSLSGFAAGSSVIVEDVHERRDARIDDRQGDSSKVNLTAGYRLWPLMGEPLRHCVAIWSLNSATINGTTYRRGRGGIPDDVWYEVTVYSVDLHIWVTSVGLSTVSMFCDPSVPARSRGNG